MSFYSAVPSMHTHVDTHAHFDTHHVDPHFDHHAHTDVHTDVVPVGTHQVYDVVGKTRMKKVPVRPGIRGRLFGPKVPVPVWKDLAFRPGGRRPSYAAVPHVTRRAHSAHAHVDHHVAHHAPTIVPTIAPTVVLEPTVPHFDVLGHHDHHAHVSDHHHTTHHGSHLGTHHVHHGSHAPVVTEVVRTHTIPLSASMPLMFDHHDVGHHDVHHDVGHHGHLGGTFVGHSNHHDVHHDIHSHHNSHHDGHVDMLHHVEHVDVPVPHGHYNHHVDIEDGYASVGYDSYAPSLFSDYDGNAVEVTHAVNHTHVDGLSVAEADFRPVYHGGERMEPFQGAIAPPPPSPGAPRVLSRQERIEALRAQRRGSRQGSRAGSRNASVMA